MSIDIHSDDGSVLDGEEFLQGKDLDIDANADGTGQVPEAATRRATRERDAEVPPPPAFAMPSAEANAAEAAAVPEPVVPAGCPPIATRAVLQRIQEAVALQLAEAREAEAGYTALLLDSQPFRSPQDAVQSIRRRLGQAADFEEFRTVALEHALAIATDAHVIDCSKSLLRKKWMANVYPALQSLLAATWAEFERWHAELVEEKTGLRTRYGHLLGGRTDVPADAVATEVRGLIGFFERQMVNNRDCQGVGQFPTTIVRGALYGQ